MPARRPAEAWLDRLADGGRLILPLTAGEFPSGDVRQGAVFRAGDLSALHSDATADGRHCASRRGTVVFHFRLASCPQNAPGSCFFRAAFMRDVQFSTSSVSGCHAVCVDRGVAVRMTLDGHKTRGAK
jgi:hypothetical protein